MSAEKSPESGENPPPRAALPKKAKAAKPAGKAKSGPKPGGVVHRVSAEVNTVAHDQHPGHSVHPRGHNPKAEIKILPHLYQPDNEKENGSGIYALAFWVKFLEERGVAAISEATGASVTFVRGLTHR
jgi:hypothetical protein